MRVWASISISAVQPINLLATMFPLPLNTAPHRLRQARFPALRLPRSAIGRTEHAASGRRANNRERRVPLPGPRVSGRGIRMLRAIAAERPAFRTLHTGRHRRADRDRNRSGRRARTAQAPQGRALQPALRGARGRRQFRQRAARRQSGRAAPSGLAHQDHDALSAVRADRSRKAPARFPPAKFPITPRSRRPRSSVCCPARPFRSRTRSARSSPSRRTTPRWWSRKRSAAMKRPSPA